MISICKNQYSASTIWELITAIVITSLVVSLSYGAYTAASRTLSTDQEKMEALNRMIYLEKDLFTLVEEAQSIEFISDLVRFQYREVCDFMNFTDSTLMINTEHGVTEKIYPLSEWNVEFLGDRSDYIRSIHIVSTINGKDFIFSFRKKYPKRFLYDHVVK